MLNGVESTQPHTHQRAKKALSSDIPICILLALLPLCSSRHIIIYKQALDLRLIHSNRVEAAAQSHALFSPNSF